MPKSRPKSAVNTFYSCLCQAQASEMFKNTFVKIKITGFPWFHAGKLGLTLRLQRVIYYRASSVVFFVCTIFTLQMLSAIHFHISLNQSTIELYRRSIMSRSLKQFRTSFMRSGSKNEVKQSRYRPGVAQRVPGC